MGVTKKDERTPEERIPGEAKEMLKSLASKWEDVTDANSLQVIPLKGAMTNEVFQIKWPTKADELSHKVVIRIYGVGVEVFFDRNDEIRTFEFMSKQGYGPRLLGRFPNGRIEEFIRARTLSASDLRDPDISLLIAAKMREFHGLNMPGHKIVYLWDRLRNWLKVAKNMCSADEVKAFRLDEIDDEINFLEKELSIDQYIGFCHNDIQYGNIMMDEETKAITIIDYEYASYNPIAFDLANHFCEMTANYHTDTPHVMDYSKYPGVEERQRFVHAYLSSSGELHGGKDAEKFLKDIENYTLGSHMFWGLWGIISEHVNKIEFDYIEYARQRLDQYWVKKSTLFGSTTTPIVDATITPIPTTADTVNDKSKEDQGKESKSEEVGVVADKDNEGKESEEEKNAGSEGAKQQSGVFKKFKRYLGFTNVFRRNNSGTSHNHPTKSSDQPTDAPESSKTTHD
ncbi:Probable choline kinase 2 [Linum perenne]